MVDANDALPSTAQAHGISGDMVDKLQLPNGTAAPGGGAGGPDRRDLPSMTTLYPLAQTLTGHSEAVVSVRFSRDGAQVASASGDATARVWDTATGQAHQSPLNHRGSGVNDVGWSWDGRMLATACDDAAVRVWDVRSGRCVRLLKDHKHHVMSCCFSPSDGILATAGYDETIRLWCMRTGRVIRIIPAHSDPILALDFSSDVCAPLLASASLDGICRLWNTHTGECVRSILPPGNPVPPFTFAKFTPNNNYLLLGTLGGKLQLWDYKGKAGGGPLPQASMALVKKTYTGHKNDQYPLQAAFLVNETPPSTGKYVVSGSEDHHIYFWDLNVKQVVGVLEGRPGPESPGPGHCDVVHAVDTSSREALVASGGGKRDCTVKLWRHCRE